MNADLRNQIAKGRDDWFASEEGQRMLDGSAEGGYLRNRLELAFLAGYRCAEKAIHQHFSDKIRTAIGKASER